MNKGLIDIAVVVAGLGIGGVIAVMNNPLTASLVFLLVLGGWEVAKLLPSVIGERKRA